MTKYVFSSLRSIAYHTVAKLVLFFIYFILFSIDFIACFFSKGKRKTSIYLVQFNLLKRKYKHPILFTKRRRKEIQEPLPFKNEIIAIFSQFQGEASYVGTIPDQIQKTIRKKFKIPPSDEIFAFIDFTILGRGKNGFAIGEKGLYFKEISDEPVFIPWKEFVDLNDIKVVRNSIEGTLPFILCIIGLNADNYNLIINDHQFFILTPIISHEDIEKLIIQFRDCAKNHYKFHR